MGYWLVKSEPSVYALADLRRDRETEWDKVRNFQARNFLREMKIDDAVLVYHSNAGELTGVAGCAAVAREALPDATQFVKGEYFEPRATREAPVWFSPRLRFEREFATLVTLPMLREEPRLQKMKLLARGNRLSVMPVTKEEFSVIVSRGTR